VDEASHLPLKLSYQGTDPFSGARTEFEEMYTDYREVSGAKYPFRTVTRQAGKLFSEFVVKEMKINAGVAEEWFKRP
jgi:hypothetical protein